MTREEYKRDALNCSVRYANYIRNVMVAGWRPEQIRAFTDSLIEEMNAEVARAIEDKDLDRFDYVCVREYFDSLEEAIDKTTSGMVDYLEVADGLF